MTKETPISEVIKARIAEYNATTSDTRSFLANDNISQFIEGDDERNLLVQEVTGKMQSLLESMVIDTENDHNTRETAHRVAKMYVNEMFKGRYHEQPKVTDFPNVTELDELYTIGPITIRSACSHHFVPILGQAWIGVKPSDKVIGISKFNRITDWMMSRPHIQEEAAMKLADKIEELIKPKGLAIVIKAQHLCMISRGVREHNSSMVNSIVRGDFRTEPHLKQEFMEVIKAQGFDGTQRSVFG